ncbi:glutamine amidotransferase [Clostridium pasteurianum DSM 525 = ATCC 6013]|uniref:Glutamine amidotransferase n=1 Tax=Clostridium pasteurianum DSM 525 = ATCC 6013 TaxID=1262449 RepID=A0A0H3JAU6_CLOPA|nr:type 1 glutamine amidotransferase [Clostridium pasteurianum]AJA49853.1 glutamine amidotransferase [Clostridium pasteurianum DSM 525 = ATCC 6013]AJA53841.1 glutamine amidotransferase [Clostridium pasteurianum DSM 525 = ATCC 6013]AOZ76996.1 amidotransferase [Clostridium pasteurianum DSM 525 = ATCC 6013]AOZ80793.1 amidotransferase [Clostridium pasteurianum]ELP57812.1 glutamine amidotransferase [Clostridium pasteurianum DSM 525 = ATCC 6013]
MYKLTGTHLYNYESLPSVDKFDWLIIMGGPMNIYEEKTYPWLKYEKQLIKEAIDKGKIVLGICLGAQLITDVLGGKVTKNPEAEIGWFPVTLNIEAKKSLLFKNFPQSFHVFQWHNDTFSTLGKEAENIAVSEACQNQAFMYKKRVIGFQFHIESSEDSIDSIIHNCPYDNVNDPYVQTKDQILSKMSYLKIANELMYNFLDELETHYFNFNQE